MSLADRLEQRRKPVKRCVLGALLEPQSELDEETRQALVSYVTDKDDRGEYLIGPTVVSSDLRETTTIDISESQVRKHRRAACACKDEALR